MDDASQARTRNALAPAEFILGVAGTLTLFFAGLLFPVALLFGANVSAYGLGEPPVCVTASDNTFESIHGNVRKHMEGLHGDVRAIARKIEVCDETPSVAQHAWGFLGTFPTTAFTLGFLGYAWSLTRLARRKGLFSPDVALGVLRLGTFVVVGALLVSCLRTYADWRLLSTMADGISLEEAVFTFSHVSWSTLIGGFGLLTVGRIMAQSVRMQREIDATV